MKTILLKCSYTYDADRWFDRNSLMSDYKHEAKDVFKDSPRYRFAGTVTEPLVITRTIETIIKKNRTIRPGEAFIIKLGGPFQEVGEQKDKVGGDEQKVG